MYDASQAGRRGVNYLTKSASQKSGAKISPITNMTVAYVCESPKVHSPGVEMGFMVKRRATTPPALEDLHKLLDGEVMEGGAENVRYNESAGNSDYYPADSFT